MIILLILSLIDILAGALLYLSSGVVSISSVLLLFVGVLVFVKGLWSLFSSFSVGNYLEWMGAIDFVGGLSLLFIFFKLFTIVHLFLCVLLLKGIYSLSLSLMRS